MKISAAKSAVETQTNDVQVTSFTKVAPFYDDLMTGVPYRFWVEYVVSLFRAHNLPPSSVLDLACGTGTASIVLARRGYHVVGTDLSEPMVVVAREKADKADLDIPFYAQDAAELSLTERFDAVVSLFDSLNNIIEPEKLALAFERVYAHLNDPGIFVFDLNTEIAFTAGMFNQKSHPIDGPLQYIWRSAYNAEERLCTVKMDFRFSPPGGGEIERFEEIHLQRAYGKDEIARMLTASGFTSVAIYDAYTHKPPKKRSDRLFFVAMKGAPQVEIGA